ncbi:unnamed protein product [Clonostachys rosea f. rosea IK726]|uniref:Uncharacterized protein n=1 Tax=Clonostachys rosea f. rosea IK726 TaxID=1349383 RepID=A0ACA9T872_BIOOC|nr:unnamed protein product [Clonostachys rosea f. rosea IK726]
MSTEVDNGKGAWTEEAKYQFLLHIIRHLREKNRTINWAHIKMGERSTKSLQNQWTKVNKQLAELDAQQGDSAPSTPNKATGKKGKRAKAEVDDEDGDDEPTPKKRGNAHRRIMAGKTRVKVEPKVKLEKNGEFESMSSED